MARRPSTARLHVLLIDDCLQERDLYEVMLKPEFEVLTAARGVEGAAIAARDHPDAIVLDVLMPGLDGWQTCQHLKSGVLTADIPVILLTGADDDNLSERAAEVGADGLLRKPCRIDELRKAVWTALRWAS